MDEIEKYTVVVGEKTSTTQSVSFSVHITAHYRPISAVETKIPWQFLKYQATRGVRLLSLSLCSWRVMIHFFWHQMHKHMTVEDG